jgi:hypothetical protein
LIGVIYLLRRLVPILLLIGSFLVVAFWMFNAGCPCCGQQCCVKECVRVVDPCTGLNIDDVEIHYATAVKVVSNIPYRGDDGFFHTKTSVIGVTGECITSGPTGCCIDVEFLMPTGDVLIGATHYPTGWVPSSGDFDVADIEDNCITYGADSNLLTYWSPAFPGPAIDLMGGLTKHTGGGFSGNEDYYTFQHQPTIQAIKDDECFLYSDGTDLSPWCSGQNHTLSMCCEQICADYSPVGELYDGSGRQTGVPVSLITLSCQSSPGGTCYSTVSPSPFLFHIPSGSSPGHVCWPGYIDGSTTDFLAFPGCLASGECDCKVGYLYSVPQTGFPCYKELYYSTCVDVDVDCTKKTYTLPPATRIPGNIFNFGCVDDSDCGLQDRSDPSSLTVTLGDPHFYNFCIFGKDAGKTFTLNYTCGRYFGDGPHYEARETSAENFHIANCYSYSCGFGPNFCCAENGKCITPDVYITFMGYGDPNVHPGATLCFSWLYPDSGPQPNGDPCVVGRNFLSNIECSCSFPNIPPYNGKICWNSDGGPAICRAPCTEQAWPYLGACATSVEGSLCPVNLSFYWEWYNTGPGGVGFVLVRELFATVTQ